MRWEQDGSMIVDAETKQDVADVFGIDETLNQRLHLIAAAPALFEALKIVERHIPRGGWGNPLKVTIRQDEASQVRAALALAVGKEVPEWL